MAAVLRSKEVAALTAARPLEELLAALITPRAIYFPIRHHSPACARHLERIIRRWQPQAILIEGPASFTPLIPLILHPKTKAPVAIYSSFTREEAETEADSPEKIASEILGPDRHASYYPLCDYSPELVALRVGTEIGAAVRFIDLDYCDQHRDEQEASRVESLQTERRFERSRYLQTLARRAGCRDHNDLWDHLFETRLHSEATEKFIRDVAAWCYYARADATEAELQEDGTVAREAAMAAAINRDMAKGTERIMVVTGGFHTVVLPALVKTKKSAAAETSPKPKDALNCVVRYSFEQLDALNGYAAGMPSPYYYDQLWRMAPINYSDAFADQAAKILVELGQLTRRKKLAVALSAADEIAALDQCRRLAAMRGHPGPTREDLLDGIRSCFVKGSMDAEGEIIFALARHALRGTAIGEVPPEAGVPPLVEDFRALARRLRLNIHDSVRRKSSLDLYRKTSHRQTSRLFHSLVFLGAPFAALTAGPDFVKGTGLERLFEHWSYQWTPQTESQLVEASIYGATIEEAAAGRLARAVTELENTGQGRNASAAVGMLVHACRMGLHRQTARLLTLITSQINEDPSLASLTAALNQLVLLWESREPLEAHRIAEIPTLIRAAYERACFLVLNLADTPVQAAHEILESLITLRDLLRSRAAGNEGLDAALFYEPLAQVFQQPKCPALLTGGVTGLLYADGRLPEPELLSRLAGSLNAASAQPGDQMPFLIGLLRSCRELAWRQPSVAESIETLLTAWSEDEFIEKLPHLRLAFADLTPRETDQVAAVVAQFHGGEKLGPLHRPEISEGEAMAAVRLNALVQKALQEDGLGSWIEDPAAVAHGQEAKS